MEYGNWKLPLFVSSVTRDVLDVMVRSLKREKEVEGGTTMSMLCRQRSCLGCEFVTPSVNSTPQESPFK